MEYFCRSFRGWGESRWTRASKGSKTFWGWDLGDYNGVGSLEYTYYIWDNSRQKIYTFSLLLLLLLILGLLLEWFVQLGDEHPPCVAVNRVEPHCPS